MNLFRILTKWLDRYDPPEPVEDFIEVSSRLRRQREFKEHVERVIREFSKGCSNAGAARLIDRESLNPADCGDCLKGAVRAIVNSSERLERQSPKFREACERIADMLRQDDGEAFFQGERFLKANAPDLYERIGDG